MSDEAKRKRGIIRLPVSIVKLAHVHHDPLPPLQPYETPKTLFDAMLLEAKDG